MKQSIFILVFGAAMALQDRLSAAETGWLTFNNRIGNVVDAPVSRPDGSGAGAGVTAQLFRVSSDGSLLPLFPTTTFRTSPAAARYYVMPDTAAVAVGSIEPFETVTLRMRAWEGKSFATASLRGESKDFFISFGGQPSLQPPMYLSGLEGFTLQLASAPVLASPRIDGKNFVFEILASPGTHVVIQSSTNLVDWQTISAQTLSEAVNYRFYRAAIE